MGQSSCGTRATFPESPCSRINASMATDLVFRWGRPLLTLGQEVASIAAQSNATAAKRTAGFHLARAIPVEKAANRTRPGQKGREYRASSVFTGRIAADMATVKIANGISKRVSLRRFMK